MHQDNDRSPNQYPKLSKEEINKLPLRKYSGSIVLVKNKNEANKAFLELKEEKVLGFDIEIRPTFKKGQSYAPSLLQFAGESSVFIVQLKKVGLCQGILQLLEDPAIIKTGVSVDFDVVKLRELKRFNKCGFFDLAKAAKKAGLNNFGLRGLAAALLGYRIPKGAQRTNWSKENLTENQLRYAATDAWVGREIYLHMFAEKMIS